MEHAQCSHIPSNNVDGEDDGDVYVHVDDGDDDDGDVAPIQMKAEALVQRCQGVNSRR